MKAKDKFRAIERQIDHLVYELYGLTAEEIAVVEGGGGRKGALKISR